MAEGTAWICGVVGLAFWGTFQIATGVWTRHDLERFAELQAVAGQTGTPDQSLWSPERVAAWRKALHESSPAPLAVLRIPKIHLEVPVLPGTDDVTLDRGLGHIEGTAQPGTDGNAGIAGHRDGFFRGLKDISPGDVIELETLHGSEVYRVERMWIVEPEDVSGTRSLAHTLADARHLLPLLLHRIGAPTVHRPRNSPPHLMNDARRTFNWTRRDLCHV